MYADHVMLNDAVRLERFREALRARVRPGSVVLDAGTGSGILAIMAVQAGAARVYAVEMRGVITLARAMARANGCDDRITFIRGDVLSVRLPEPVDGVVCELLGYAGLAEGITRTLPRIIERHLKPGAWRIPRALRVFAAAVSHPAMHERLMLTNAHCGVDFSPVRHEITQNYWVESLAGADIAAGPAPVFAADWDAPPPCPPVNDPARMRVTRDGDIHGFGAWFEADLAPGVTLDTSPGAPLTSWRQVLFPLQQPLPVRRGDFLSFSLTPLPMVNGDMFHWRCAHEHDGRTLFESVQSNALTSKNLDAFAPSGDPQKQR